MLAEKAGGAAAVARLHRIDNRNVLGDERINVSVIDNGHAYDNDWSNCSTKSWVAAPMRRLGQSLAKATWNSRL